jgi:hypothetical protein
MITGTGVVTLLQGNQIADTATVTYNKAAPNLGTVVFANETVAAVNVLNGADTGSQFQSNNGFVVTAC